MLSHQAQNYQKHCFLDGTVVPTDTDIIYIGANIYDKADVQREISRRISSCVYTWKKLSAFGKHSTCSAKTKINIYTAVICAKLVYGLHTVRLLDHQLNSLNAFQLRGLRQILKIPTTFGQMVAGQARTNTNEYV